MTPSDAAAGDAASGLCTAHPSGSGLRLDVANNLAATALVLEAVRDHLAAHSVGERGIYNSELLIEELFTNTVRHGYNGDGAHRISIRIDVAADAISFEFDDDAKEFDPTLQAAPPAFQSLEDAPIGGLGLPLVRKMAQSMVYRRSSGHNLLSIRIANN